MVISDRAEEWIPSIVVAASGVVLTKFHLFTIVR